MRVGESQSLGARASLGRQRIWRDELLCKELIGCASQKTYKESSSAFWQAWPIARCFTSGKKRGRSGVISAAAPFLVFGFRAEGPRAARRNAWARL